VRIEGAAASSRVARKLQPHRCSRSAKLPLLALQGVLLVVQQAIVGEGVILVRRLGKGRERLDSPIKPCLAVSTPSVRLALNDEREEPPIRLAHDVAARNLARCSRFRASSHRANAGKAQLAIPPVRARCEPNAVAVVLEANPEKRS
jgi:hypothetical protein